jgi:hypothetical protein
LTPHRPQGGALLFFLSLAKLERFEWLVGLDKFVKKFEFKLPALVSLSNYIYTPKILDSRFDVLDVLAVLAVLDIQVMQVEQVKLVKLAKLAVLVMQVVQV